MAAKLSEAMITHRTGEVVMYVLSVATVVVYMVELVRVRQRAEHADTGT